MPYNPFAPWRITGTWENHALYSAGGTDYPLPVGTDLPAPAAGTLRISGGSGEFAAGYIGSVGRRSILTLDTPIQRVVGRKSIPPEGEGPMVAIVFQHQLRFGVPGHYSEGQDLGDSGDSDGTPDGGDDHLHIHGLNAQGQRLRFESFITSSSPAGGGYNPVPGAPGANEEDDMGIQLRVQEGGGLGRTFFVEPGIITHVVHDDVVRVNNYVGVPGGGQTNQVSVQDLRRLVEVRGFNFDVVNSLIAGEAAVRNGSGQTIKVPAGHIPWPAGF